jgi:hypothetical protein
MHSPPLMQGVRSQGHSRSGADEQQHSLSSFAQLRIWQAHLIDLKVSRWSAELHLFGESSNERFVQGAERGTAALPRGRPPSMRSSAQAGYGVVIAVRFSMQKSNGVLAVVTVTTCH